MENSNSKIKTASNKSVTKSETTKASIAKPEDNNGSIKKNVIKLHLDALSLVQLKSAKLDAKFYEELHLLECKYNLLNQSFRNMRKDIISGKTISTEYRLKEIPSLYKPYFEDLENKKKLIVDQITNLKPVSGGGIPDFWLTVLKKNGLISQLIEPYDEPVLKHLIDLDVELGDKKPYHFKLNFYFSPNEYFTNALLTKTYKFKIDLDPSDPLKFDVPEILASVGCIIDWNKGKQPSEVSSQYKINGEEHMPTHSFFNFFDTQFLENKKKDELTLQEEYELAMDYEIGYAIKDVIPRAVLYYFDEIIDDEDSVRSFDESSSDDSN